MTRAVLALLLVVACSPRALLPPPAPVTIAPVEKPLNVAPLTAPPERLPHTFEPTRYAVHLHVDPAQPAFSGTIEITGTLAEPTALIWLNAEDLVIDAVTAKRDAESVRMRPSLQPHGMMGVQSEQPLAAGTWTLVIAYSGTWNDRDAEGGFREAVSSDHYVFTQFEPDFARRVFPCFDEPDRKVPWQLTLDVPDELTVVTNAPAEKETRTGPHTTKTVQFAPTLPLPSYLIAFAVGPFEVIDAGRSSHGAPIRILVERGQSAQAAHAVASTAQLLGRLESWLGVPYPYPKLDLVAVPRTQGWWNAMENAGMITFAAQNLLVDAVWDSVTTHELAHQWFGDLVTLAWWDDLWLNESFAYWIANRFEPMQPSDDVVASEPIVMDGTANPRLFYVGNRFYGAIGKGARLLELLERAVSAPQLPAVLRRYLEAHQQGTVHSADFVRTLREVTQDEALAGVFARYLSAPSYLIDVALSCNSRARQLVVNGLAPRSTSPVAERSGLVCFAYDHDGSRRDRCAIVTEHAPAVDLGTKRCPRWVLPASLHEVALDDKQLAVLRDIAWPQLTGSEQSSVLARGLQAGTTRERWAFLARAATGTDAGVLARAASYLVDIDREIPPALRPAFNRWVVATFGPRARSTALPVATTTTDAWLLFVVLNAGDSKLRDAVLTLEPQRTMLDALNRWLLVTAEVGAKPLLADDLLEGLSEPTSETSNAAIVGARPDLLDLLDRHHTATRALPDHVKQMLIGKLCDGARRRQVEDLVNAIFDKPSPMLMRNFDQCVAERKALEPELRAFLKVK